MNVSHPVGLLIGSEDVVLSITAFLSAKDCLNLHAVSRGWHHCIGRIDETLFEKHLRCDFDEGEVLVYVAEKKNLSYKKLYRAFRGRWSLPKQVDPTQASLKTRILTNWSKQSVSDIPKEQYRGAKILVPNNDVDNMVFIASIRGEDGDSRNALLDWNPECTSWRGAPRPRGQLIIDKSWCDEKGNLVLPQSNVDYIDDSVEIPFALTLHAIDTKYYQVASLLDNSPLDEAGCCRDWGGDESKIELYYGHDCPSLFTMPPRGSPFYREFTESDFFDEHDGYLICPPGLLLVPSIGRLVLNEFEQNVRIINDDDSDYECDYEYKLHALDFSFGDMDRPTLQWPHHVCSFLRALMREKCLQIESSGHFGADVVQQPRWVQDRKILDTVTSFLYFEDQAFKLRLVCRQFCNSAMRQLQAKLDRNKRIGFKREAWQEPFEWEMFQATVRQGWSGNCLTSEESAIDDALWLASCRCYLCGESCEDRESCKNASITYLECHGYNSKIETTETQTIDKGIIRQKLRSEGSVRLVTEDRSYGLVERSKVECSFEDEEEEMNLFDLCRKLEEEILSGAGGEDTHSGICVYTGMPIDLHWKLQKDYGVVHPSSTSRAGYISHKQFVRAIFLLFTRAFDEGEGTLTDEDTPKKKKARSSQDITISIAKSNIEFEDGQYSRAKKIIRFCNSTSNAPIEICIESIHYLSKLKRSHNSSRGYTSC